MRSNRFNTCAVCARKVPAMHQEPVLLVRADGTLHHGIACAPCIDKDTCAVPAPRADTSHKKAMHAHG